jgi:hypothetical protein
MALQEAPVERIGVPRHERQDANQVFALAPIRGDVVRESRSERQR